MDNVYDIQSGLKANIDELEKKVGAKDVLANLESGENEILGVKLYPEKAVEAFESAVRMVKAYGQDVSVDLSEIYFQNLPKNMVGEAREDGVYLDPECLKYSPLILAKVLYHELRHHNKDVMNEGMVEAGVELRFGADSAEHPYQEEVKNFLEFARRFDPQGDAETGEKKIYQMYLNHQFEEIFEQYEEQYIEKQNSDQAKDWAFDFFTQVFPELRYGGKEPGSYDLYEIQVDNAVENSEDEKPSIAQETSAKVIDLFSGAA